MPLATSTVYYELVGVVEKSLPQPPKTALRQIQERQESRKHDPTGKQKPPGPALLEQSIYGTHNEHVILDVSIEERLLILKIIKARLKTVSDLATF